MRRRNSNGLKRRFKDPKERKKTSEASKKMWASGGFKETHKKSMIVFFSDPKTGKKISDGIKSRHNNDPGYRKKLSEASKKKWVDPAYRKKHKEAMIVAQSDPKFKKRHSEIMTKRFSNPEEREKISATLKKIMELKTPKERKIQHGNPGKSNPNYGKKLSDEQKAAISRAQTGRKQSLEQILAKCGANCNLWKGGTSNEEYCDAWIDREYKQSIKDRDSNKCQNPTCRGKSKRLAIHHINYNKKDCGPVNLITLCTSCNSRANHNRDFWQAQYEHVINDELFQDTKEAVIQQTQ